VSSSIFHVSNSEVSCAEFHAVSNLSKPCTLFHGINVCACHVGQLRILVSFVKFSTFCNIKTSQSDFLAKEIKRFVNLKGTH
jgi:hypothetical protein